MSMQTNYKGLKSHKISWFFYEIGVRFFSLFKRNRKLPVNATAQKVREKFFLAAILIYPLTIFIIFYIVVNIECILLAFKSYNPETGGYVWNNVDPFINFSSFFKQLKEEEFMSIAFKNSTILFATSMLINLPFHILNAYYIYKKHALYRTYRLLLFLPSILSSVLTTTIFAIFLSKGLQPVYNFFNWGEVPDFFSTERGFATSVFYSAWISFGGSLILFLGLMNRIPNDVIEAAQIDGVKPFQEFIYIVLPLIFPTITIYIITGIAGFFSNQGSILTFFGTSANAQFQTFGYYYFVKVLGDSGPAQYPMAAASGLVFTLIVAPITLLARFLLNKFFPSEEY